MFSGIFCTLVVSLESLFRLSCSFLLILAGSLSLKDNQNLLSTTLRRQMMKSTNPETDLIELTLQSFFGNSCSKIQITLGQRDWSCFNAFTMVLVSHLSFKALGESTMIIVWHFSDSVLSWVCPETTLNKIICEFNKHKNYLVSHYC